MSKNKILLLALSLTLTPLSAGAQATVGSITGKAKLWLGNIIPILIGVALLFFIWNVIQVIRAEGDKREDAKKGMWAGVIAMFVIVSIWGIITFIGKSLDINPGGNIEIPQFSQTST